jgi:leucyl aminopeptidase
MDNSTALQKTATMKKSSSSLLYRPALILLLLSACMKPALHPTVEVSPTTTPLWTVSVPTPPAPAIQPSLVLVLTPTPAVTQTIPPVNTQTAQTNRPLFDCTTANPVTAQILDQVNSEAWLKWVRQLTGEEPIENGFLRTSLEPTRYSPTMFGSYPKNSAWQFIQTQVQQWYSQNQIEIQTYSVENAGQGSSLWQNLIITIPGETSPEQSVILSAHADSTARGNPEKSAPGADDNASGAAALIETAQLLQHHRFNRTIKIIWFTGEEEGLLGSKAYVRAFVKDPSKIVADVNLDMFAYDADNDHCFELHVGKLPQSDRVGQCFVQSLSTYNLGLMHPDYLTAKATDRSDHGSFWAANVGAVEVLENLFDSGQPDGCKGADANPNYHTANDTSFGLNPDTASQIIRAALATVLTLAVVEQ